MSIKQKCKHTKKYLLKSLLIAMIVFMAILPHSVSVYAATQSSLLFTLSQTRNMSITVAYDSEIPDIAFISPSGEKYKEGRVTDDKMTVKHIEGAINYLIPNAAPGDWYIEYDKLTNSTLDVNYAPYAKSIQIESFTVTDIADDRANVSFKVSYADNSLYEYVIYAVTTDQNSRVTGQKELMKGSAAAGGAFETSVPLSSLSSYDNYRLMLEVYLDSSGIEVFDTAITGEAFSYSNSRATEKISDFYAEINLTEESVLIDWKDYSRYCDEYIIAVYTSTDLNEPMFSTVYESWVTDSSLNIDTTAEFIRVELSYRINGITSEILRKDIYLDNGISISVSTQDMTSSSQAIIDYDIKNSINAIVSVNGKTDEVRLTGNGQFSVILGEFSNDLKISYSPEQNVSFIVESNIYSDQTAPILLLYENKTAITTNEPSYTLVGETEPACILKINDETIHVNEDGTFSHKLALSMGNNEFTVTSTDKAGNSSMQKINIRRGDGPVKAAANDNPSPLERYLPLILTFLATIAIVICIFVFSRIYSVRAPEGKVRAALSILRNIFVILCPFSLQLLAFFLYKRQSASRIINTAQYSELVGKSVQDAYQAIAEYEKYNKYFITSCFVLGAIVLITLLLTLLVYYLKRRKDKEVS